MSPHSNTPQSPISPGQPQLFPGTTACFGQTGSYLVSTGHNSFGRSFSAASGTGGGAYLVGNQVVLVDSLAQGFALPPVVSPYGSYVNITTSASFGDFQSAGRFSPISAPSPIATSTAVFQQRQQSPAAVGTTTTYAEQASSPATDLFGSSQADAAVDPGRILPTRQSSMLLGTPIDKTLHHPGAADSTEMTHNNTDMTTPNGGIKRTSSTRAGHRRVPARSALTTPGNSASSSASVAAYTPSVFPQITPDQSPHTPSKLNSECTSSKEPAVVSNRSKKPSPMSNQSTASTSNPSPDSKKPKQRTPKLGRAKQFPCELCGKKFQSSGVSATWPRLVSFG